MLTGEQRFTLLPPSDIAFLGEANFPSARHHFDDLSGEWSVDLDPAARGEMATASAIQLDPTDVVGARRGHGAFASASPVTVTVLAEQMLYIPALWYHTAVSAKPGDGVSIAVNYRYESTDGPSLACHRLARALAGLESE